MKLARRVTHRNVARTFDIGEHGGEHFLTMEFVDGRVARRADLDEGPLSTDEACAIARAVCAGLAAAHARRRRAPRPQARQRAPRQVDGRVVDHRLRHRARADGASARRDARRHSSARRRTWRPSRSRARRHRRARRPLRARRDALRDAHRQRAWAGRHPFAVAPRAACASRRRSAHSARRARCARRRSCCAACARSGGPVSRRRRSSPRRSRTIQRASTPRPRASFMPAVPAKQSRAVAIAAAACDAASSPRSPRVSARRSSTR